MQFLNADRVWLKLNYARLAWTIGPWEDPKRSKSLLL